ncbi:hypothetical protein FHP88_15795 [Sedimenticola selenatireducens]|uniref:DUF4376 domain-containing protein n=1 Tax=Sedimenticola selenatireducens TaxID=191960 RepID=A0A557S0F8_9GAMM|nr:hypothetical protein [Sedimenticola selenatireducens]TVO70915.1 hypothetical protein FHP88_15795 [Sedimenticola selenatireducens]
MPTLNQIIDNSQTDWDGFPDSLNGERFLGFGSDGLSSDPKDGYLTELVMPQKSLVDIKASKLEEMLDACEAQIRAGFISNALGDDHLYDTAKDSDQLNLIAAGLGGIDIPFTCTKLSDGVKAQRLHTAVQITQVYTAASAEKVRLLGVMDSLRTAISTAVSVVDVEAITWTG